MYFYIRRGNKMEMKILKDENVNLQASYIGLILTFVFALCFIYFCCNLYTVTENVYRGGTEYNFSFLNICQKRHLIKGFGRGQHGNPVTQPPLTRHPYSKSLLEWNCCEGPCAAPHVLAGRSGHRTPPTPAHFQKQKAPHPKCCRCTGPSRHPPTDRPRGSRRWHRCYCREQPDSRQWRHRSAFARPRHSPTCL